ncbi:FtsX-like permease family protein [Clostridium sp. MSJ-4]|uniref:FtsX-like permease family protein n=1 Tax=Clostridium simiarum TaxID=2841506 RepID=A0ABS6F0Q2_9CLOT|nr:FtsX-like permease family protein [Clostridium simiarum]MBU5591970.1 FtsX-like permease family protein [Clostridium simiarum]
MKTYKSITTKYMKVQKKRTLLTILGIIMSIALISGTGTIFYSYRDARIQDVKQDKGDYEVRFKNISKNQIDTLKNHTEFKDISIVQYIGFGKIHDTPKEEMKESTPKFKYTYLKAYDDKSLKDTFTINLLEGRLPENSNEIIIEKGALRYLDPNLKLGDKINFPFGIRKDSKDNEEVLPANGFSDTEIFEEKYEKEYTLVGIIKPKFFSTSHFMYDSITLLDNLKDNENNYSSYMKIISDKNKRGIATSVASSFGISFKEDNKDLNPSIDFNDPLLNLYGQNANALKNDSLFKVITFIIVLIIVCTVALIYNSFNISVLERISQFGVLRSIGATPRQIRTIVLREALIISIISIPIGFLSGVLAIKIVITLLGGVNFLSIKNFNISLKPEVFLLSLILGFLTVFLSALFPALMAGNITPLEAVRNNKNIKKERFKKSKSNNRLIKLLFNVEGVLAHKNIRRNKKRFIITVFSLVVSIVMFITFNSLANLAKASNSRESSPYYDSFYLTNSKDGFTDNQYTEIKDLNGVEQVYKTTFTNTRIAVEKNRIDPYFLDRYNLEDVYKDSVFTHGTIKTYDENAFKLLKSNLTQGNLDTNSLDDFDIIIVNKNKVRVDNKWVVKDFYNYKVGDELKLPKVDYTESRMAEDFLNSVKDSIAKDNTYSLKIVGILNSDPLDSYDDSYGLTIIMSNRTYENVIGNLKFKTMLLKLSDDKNTRESVRDFFQQKSVREDVMFDDFQKQVEEENQSTFQLKVFVYGFITVITLISAVNIINTISTNLLLRKREFATLKAIGMSQSQVIKLVLLEGTLHGILASIFGSIIGTILSFVLFSLSGALIEVSKEIPWNSIIIASLGSILISLIASLLPLKKIKNENIVENIRMEE